MISPRGDGVAVAFLLPVLPGPCAEVCQIEFEIVSIRWVLIRIANPNPTAHRSDNFVPMATTQLAVGAKAPAFTLADQTDTKVKLSGFAGTKVLVYFYPKADTPGCTTQSCGLRDIAKKIGDTVIIGISPDLPAKLAKFDDKYKLGFTLLSDPEHVVAEKFGVWGEKSMYGKKYMGIVRSAFLIDEKGKIEQSWYKVSPKDTPANLLKALGK